MILTKALPLALALVTTTPALTTAQATSPPIRVLVTSWRNPDLRLALQVGALVREKAEHLLSPTEAQVYSWRNILNTLEGDGAPRDTLSLHDLRMLGRLMRAHIVIDVGVIRQEQDLTLEPVLIVASTDSAPVFLERVIGRTLSEAADRLAHRIAREARLRARQQRSDAA